MCVCVRERERVCVCIHIHRLSMKNSNRKHLWICWHFFIFVFACVRWAYGFYLDSLIVAFFTIPVSVCMFVCCVLSVLSDYFQSFFLPDTHTHTHTGRAGKTIRRRRRFWAQLQLCSIAIVTYADVCWRMLTYAAKKKQILSSAPALQLSDYILVLTQWLYLCTSRCKHTFPLRSLTSFLSLVPLAVDRCIKSLRGRRGPSTSMCTLTFLCDRLVRSSGAISHWKKLIVTR